MKRPWASQVDEAQRLLWDRLSALRDYLDDSTVTEIMLNPTAEGEIRVFIERAGRMTMVDARVDQMAVDASIRAIMMLNDKDVGSLMDARLAGVRVAAALPPVSIHGPMLVIRKHASRRFRLDEYVQSGAFLPGGGAAGQQTEHGMAAQDDFEHRAAQGGLGLLEFLRWAVQAQRNIIVCGGTGSGKTTLLSSCMLEVSPDDRVITCEDTNEIVLDQPNVVQLEANAAHGIGIRDLIRTCLRSRPDRIIVGEIRGPEAYDFLDAMNTGHGGSLCTLHADSASLALQRLESLMRMSPNAANLPLRDMRAQIASAIHYVVFQARVGGVRGPREVIGLDGIDERGEYRIRRIYAASSS